MTEFSADFDLALAAPEIFLGNCKGSNNGLVFIGMEAENEPEARTAFLKKILAALKLELDRDTIYTTLEMGEPASFCQLLKKKGIEKMVVFGLSPRQFGLAFEAKLYEPIAFYGCKFLFSEKLSLIETDQERKAKLWAALKSMFG